MRHSTRPTHGQTPVSNARPHFLAFVRKTRRNFARRIVQLVSFLTCICLTVWLTPVVIESNGVRLGLYRWETNRFGQHVIHRKVQGVGLSLTSVGVGLGYVRNEAIVAELEDASYRVSLPRGELFVGAAAETDGVHEILHLLESKSEDSNILVKE